jgi:hypothetical protein
MSSNVLSRDYAPQNETYLVSHQLLFDWPEQGIKAGNYCIVREGSVAPGRLICLQARGRKFISMLLRRELDGVIHIQGRSGNIFKLRRHEYEIEGAVEEIKERLLSVVPTPIIFSQGKCWGWTADKNGVIAPCPGWTDFSGLAPESVNEWIYRVHPDERESSVRQWEEGSQLKQLFQITHHVLNRAGLYVRVLNLAAPVLNLDGEIEGWTGLSQII